MLYDGNIIPLNNMLIFNNFLLLTFAFYHVYSSRI